MLKNFDIRITYKNGALSIYPGDNTVAYMPNAIKTEDALMQIVDVILDYFGENSTKKLESISYQTETINLTDTLNN